MVGLAASIQGQAWGGDAKKKTDEASKKTETAETPTIKLKFEATKADPLPEIGKDGGAGETVAIIPIEGTIELGLSPFVLRAIEEAKDAQLIVLSVDTFGGRVDAAVTIRDAILATKIPTVAYVNRRAISAGALISLAADHLVFAPGGSMGAATPIQVQGGQAQAVGEKMVSYMRSEMRATAEANGRSGALAEAMVDADVEIKDVIQKGKLLTLTTEKARKLGMANDVVDTMDELLKKFGLEKARRQKAEVNWAEKISRFLTDPVVSGLLMSIGMLGIFLELYSPGFGITGIIGLAGLLLFFGGHMFAQLAGWEEMALFLVGILALGIEVFVIPGFGVAGVIGIALIAIGLMLSMTGLPLMTSWDTGILEDVGVTVMAALFVTGIGSLIIIRFLPGSPMGRWLVLETTLGGTTDGALPDADQAWEVASDDKRGYVGMTGYATTDLRPSGKMQIDDEVIDVVSRDAWINRGTPIRVTEVEGIRIVVVEDV
jgi:membrane-bound serine protease (ClpP class)